MKRNQLKQVNPRSQSLASLSGIGSALVKAGLTLEVAKAVDIALAQDEEIFNFGLFDSNFLDAFDGFGEDSELDEFGVPPRFSINLRGNVEVPQMPISPQDRQDANTQLNAKEAEVLPQNEEFNLTTRAIQYNTQQDSRVDDLICLPLEGEVFFIDDTDRPVIPDTTHPNCRCFWSDAETGEFLGQDGAFGNDRVTQTTASIGTSASFEGKEGVWRTVNGVPIFFPEGEDGDEVMKKAFEELKTEQRKIEAEEKESKPIDKREQENEKKATDILAKDTKGKPSEEAKKFHNEERDRVDAIVKENEIRMNRNEARIRDAEKNGTATPEVIEASKQRQKEVLASTKDTEQVVENYKDRLKWRETEANIEPAGKSTIYYDDDVSKQTVLVIKDDIENKLPSYGQESLKAVELHSGDPPVVAHTFFEDGKEKTVIGTVEGHYQSEAKEISLYKKDTAFGTLDTYDHEKGHAVWDGFGNKIERESQGGKLPDFNEERSKFALDRWLDSERVESVSPYHESFRGKDHKLMVNEGFAELTRMRAGDPVRYEELRTKHEPMIRFHEMVLTGEFTNE